LESFAFFSVWRVFPLSLMLPLTSFFLFVLFSRFVVLQVYLHRPLLLIYRVVYRKLPGVLLQPTFKSNAVTLIFLFPFFPSTLIFDFLHQRFVFSFPFSVFQYHPHICFLRLSSVSVFSPCHMALYSLVPRFASHMA